MHLDGKKKNKLNNFINGGISGITSIMFTQPLQCIRTTLIVNYKKQKPSGVISTAKEIFEKEGIKGFYRGFTPTIIKNSIGGSLYFGLLEHNKLLIKGYKLNESLQNFCASAGARGFQCLIINPLIITSTRFEVLGFNAYDNFLDAIIKIKKEEGLSGFFKGIKPFMAKEIPSTAMFFTLYEKLKHLIGPMEFIDSKYKVSLCSFTAAAIVTTLNNPLDVLRTRIQYLHFSHNTQHDYKGIINGVVQICRNEGFRGLTLGIGPRLVRRTISNTIVWTVYEHLKFKSL